MSAIIFIIFYTSEFFVFEIILISSLKILKPVLFIIVHKLELFPREIKLKKN